MPLPLDIYTRGHRAAFYVRSSNNKFLTISEDGAIGMSSSPHAATLFTLKARAETLAKQMEREIADVKFGVFHCRTHEPNVIVG